MLDVLFINPSDQRETYQHLADEITALEPPIQCRLLASYVRKKGYYSVDICDMQVSALAPAEAVRLYNPRLVVVVAHGNQPSASTQSMPAAIKVCRDLKDAFPDESKGG